MMTVDERFMAAPVQLCFRVAADVERWPEFLPHYRWVKFHRQDAFGTGRVEMAAWREFGPGARYPTWWLSEMVADEGEPAIYFQHVAGVTRRMDVKWSFAPRDGGTHVRITHDWQGPSWPLIGRFAWEHVIGPHFVSFIATRTLAGVAAEAERRAGLADTATDATTESQHAR
jgi:ribosome-associated toxin RatA of RatAB toxin-antitoxin module